MQALGKLKAAEALAILSDGVKTESPDNFLRNAALRAFGALGDDKAAGLLREWAMPGKDIESREAAIFSLARLDKGNKEITAQIAGYLTEPHYPIRYAAIAALGSREDASAVPALEALLKRDDLSIEMAPTVKRQIAKLQKAKDGKKTAGSSEDGDDEGAEGGEAAVSQRLEKLEQLMREMNDRLKMIEAKIKN